MWTEVKPFYSVYIANEFIGLVSFTGGSVGGGT